MPMYPFKCKCGYTTECLLEIADRDKLRQCGKCRKKMKRALTNASLGKPVHRTKAILAGGQKVSGQWDK